MHNGKFVYSSSNREMGYGYLLLRLFMSVHVKSKVAYGIVSGTELREDDRYPGTCRKRNQSEALDASAFESMELSNSFT